MKHRFAFILALFATLSTLLPQHAVAQARRIPPGGGSSSAPTSAPSTAPASSAGGVAPAELYKEASDYTEKKMDEFTRKKVPFNPAVLEQTMQEQRRLASLNATQLAMRSNLAGEDIYYLGMLYHLSQNEERAIETLNRFLKEKSAKNEQAQTARYIIALDLAKTNHLAEAESALSDYAAHTPRRTSEQANIEHSIAKAYRKDKQLERAAAHAEEAFKIAKTVEPTVANASLQDYWLFNTGNALVELYQEMKKPVSASAAVLEEVRRLALENKSARLYADATTRLANLLVDSGHKAEAFKMVEDSLSQLKTYVKDADARRVVQAELERKQKQLKLQGELAPEMAMTKWIGQSPVSLADLRGHVVLLDFWATWCVPCVAAFPHLVEWHDKYKDKGLVILGITKFYGEAEGQSVDKDYEFGFLERFRKLYRLPYAIVVAGNDDTHQRYGVSSIPTAVIIDRHGIVRYIGTGIVGPNEQQVTEMLEKLIEEQ